MTKEPVKLIKVEANANNNKFYEMNDNGDGTFTATWGRVGNAGQSKTYLISQWDSKYRQKTSEKKGYKDVTEFRTEVNTTSMLAIDDPDLDQFFASLQRYSKDTVGSNYSVEVRDVTKAQVEEAQRLLNEMSDMVTSDKIQSDANNLLQELYQIIPRKMRRVSDELIQESKSFDGWVKEFKERLTKEQDLLDVMKAEVDTNQAKNDAGDEVAKMTLMDLLGIQADVVRDAATIDMIKKKMGDDKRRFVRAYMVNNVKTDKGFMSFVGAAKNKRRELLWHGSRNENWLSIMKAGLVLRPTNAVITGKMLGYGSYFSPLCRKSIGYTSVSGSYWASGSAKKGYLALYDVHVGNPKEDNNFKSEYQRLNWDKLRQYGDYDSFWMHSGYVRNPEVVVYQEPQSTIRYIVEFE